MFENCHSVFSMLLQMWAPTLGLLALAISAQWGQKSPPRGGQGDGAEGTGVGHVKRTIAVSV